MGIAKSWLIGKDSDAGRDWGQEERGGQRMRWRMASLTRWTWVWVNSRGWWWTGRPGMLRFMGSQRQTRLSDWTELMGILVSLVIILRVLYVVSTMKWIDKICSFFKKRFFFDVDHFKSLSWISYNTVFVLYFGFFFGLEACGILVPWPGIETTSPAVEGKVFTTWPPGKSPEYALSL